MMNGCVGGWWRRLFKINLQLTSYFPVYLSQCHNIIYGSTYWLTDQLNNGWSSTSQVDNNLHYIYLFRAVHRYILSHNNYLNVIWKYNNNIFTAQR